MSPKPFLLTAVLALSLTGAAGVANAQAPVNCKIPFAFSLEGQMFPSGTYTVTPRFGDRGLMLVSNVTGTQARFVLVQPESEPLSANTFLLFHRYGDHYYLASVEIGGEGLAFRVPRSASEREVASRETGVAVTLLASR